MIYVTIIVENGSLIFKLNLPLLGFVMCMIQADIFFYVICAYSIFLLYLLRCLYLKKKSLLAHDSCNLLFLYPIEIH